MWSFLLSNTGSVAQILWSSHASLTWPLSKVHNAAQKQTLGSFSSHKVSTHHTRRFLIAFLNIATLGSSPQLLSLLPSNCWFWVWASTAAPVHGLSHQACRGVSGLFHFLAFQMHMFFYLLLQIIFGYIIYISASMCLTELEFSLLWCWMWCHCLAGFLRKSLR